MIILVGMYCVSFRVTIWNGDSGAVCRMTEPLLHNLHRYTVGDHQACT